MYIHTYVFGNTKYVCLPMSIYFYIHLFLFLSGKCAENFYNSSGIWTSPFLAMRKTLIYIYLCIYACETYRYMYICIYTYTYVYTNTLARVCTHQVLIERFALAPPKCWTFTLFRCQNRASQWARERLFISEAIALTMTRRFRSVQQAIPYPGQLAPMLLQSHM